MNDLFSINGQNSATQIFGQDGINTLDDPETYSEIYQGTEPTCAIRSQQIILRDFGIDLSQDYLTGLAEQNGWYIDHTGTPIEAIGNLLESQGVGVHTQENATVYDLVNELAQGRRVIVTVDAGELWAVRDDDPNKQAQEDFEDSVNAQGADHALIVAGIEVNPDDPNDVKVILTDPGTGDLRLEYPMEEFIDAWQDSNCHMVATDQPAPYQYNPATGQMEPSNFAVDSGLNDKNIDLDDDALVNPDVAPDDTDITPDDNDFGMNPNDINMPDNYTPHYFEGHLNYIPFNLTNIPYNFPGIYDPWLDFYNGQTLHLGWNDWHYAYDLAMVDGTFNIHPFMTQVMVVFVPVPTDPIPVTPLEPGFTPDYPDENRLELETVKDDDDDDDDDLTLA